MTNIIKIPARSQAYLFAQRDAAADKFDVKKFAWPYLNVSIGDLPDVYLEMIDTDTVMSEDDAVTFHETEEILDTTDYDGTCTYFFELCGYNCDSWGDTPGDGVTHDVTLLCDGSPIATITLALNWDDVWVDYIYDYHYYRTEFTPTAGSHSYKIKLEGDTIWSSDAQFLSSARIIIRQRGASKTRIQIPLMEDRSGTNSDSYVEIGVQKGGLWQYNADDFGTITKLEFGGRGKAFTGTSYMMLYNRTDDTSVPGSELTFSSSTPSEQFVEFSRDDLEDGDVYEPRVKKSGTYPGYYGAYIYVTIESLSTLSVWQRVSHQCDWGYWGGQDDYVDMDSRLELNLTDVPAAMAVYYESVGYRAPLCTGSRNTSLRYDNGNLCGDGGSNVASATHTGSAKSIVRGGSDIRSSLVDGGKYIAWFDRSDPRDGYHFAAINRFIVFKGSVVG